MANFYQWRLWIGPPYESDLSDTRFPWENYTENGAYSFSMNTTLTSTLASGATTAAVADASAFPPRGGCWIGPNGTGEAWEYVGYPLGFTSTSIPDLRRESATTREHNGVHTSGAVVRPFYPVDSNDGRLHLVEEMNESLSVVTWYADISGVAIPQHAIRNRHCAIVEWRATALELPWAVLLIGFLESPTVRDDYRRYREWSARIVPASSFMQGHRVKGIRLGELDIAQNGSVRATLPLANASDERDTGDYTAADPPFNGSNVIDGDNDTLWIAERVIGTNNSPDANDDPYLGFLELHIAEVYINPPPGAPDGSRYIIVGAYGNTTISNWSVWSEDIIPGSPFEHSWVFDGPGSMSKGEYFALVEDASIFNDQHPLSDVIDVFENATFFDHIQPSGGSIVLRYDDFVQWNAIMAWGTGGYPPSSSAQWDDLEPKITAPGPGETMRYIWHPVDDDPEQDPDAPADYWVTDKYRTGGYTIDITPDEWLINDLPGIGLILANDITPTSPGVGELLYINDAAGPSTSGLDAAGTLQVGNEQMGYGDRNDAGYVTITARGANGTAAAAHDDGDAVYMVIGGIPTDAPLVESYSWYRAGGTIYPHDFTIKRSSLITLPRTPEEDSFNFDWTVVEDQTTYNSATYTYTFSPSIRVKHFLIQIERMTDDPARPRLNRVEILLDPVHVDASLFMDEATLAGDLIERILQNAGFPDNGIVVNAGTQALYEITTADDNAWTVIGDIAEYAGCRVVVGRDSKVTVSNDTFWVTSPTAAHTWSESNVAQVEKVFTGNKSISQVRLAWETPDGTTGGTEVYPATASDIGTPLEVGPLLYPDALSAGTAAKKLYIQNRFPFTSLVDCADAQRTIRPGVVHRLNWTFADDMQQIDRLYLGIGTDHMIENNAWSTVLNLMQIERESDT